MSIVQFTLESSNGKVGPMPVSTSSNETCPDACPLKASGCYADYGPLGIIWRKLSDAAAAGRLTAPGPRGATYRFLDWKAFCGAISQLALGAIWRHNQAGDLPGKGDSIDRKALRALVRANRGRRGFTYTHKPLTKANAAAIAEANAAGFTVNLSADNLAEADTLAASGVGPVVVVLPAEVQGNARIATPEGRKVKVCPATYLDDMSCVKCQWCQKQDRTAIIGFPAHGAGKRKASAIAAA